MHYSIQQELGRAHYDDLLGEAARARVAKVARKIETPEPTRSRFDGLRVLFQRLRVAHVHPVTAH